MIERTTSSYHHAQGAVLIVSLILLLAMTLIGVAAIDSSSLQSQMATNNQRARSLYQATLSEIQAQYRKLAGLDYLNSVKNSATSISDTLPGVSIGGPGLILTGDDIITARPTLTQEAYIVFTGENNAPLSGYSLNDFGVYSYEINAISEVTGTNTQSDQTQGLQRPVPVGQDQGK
ncbi:MAG: PilX N-terminal domain-containing pilus assembly protein [Spongiibacteraceae bacterium]